MNNKLKELIQNLEENNIGYNITKNPSAQVVKTIVFKTKKNDFFAVCVLKEDRVCYKRLRSKLGMKVSTLHPDELRRLGWEPGECCPLSIKLPLIIDNKIFNFNLIATGSGDVNYGLEFDPKILLKYNPVLCDISVEDKKTSE